MMRRVFLCASSLGLLVFSLLGLTGIFDALTPTGSQEQESSRPPDSMLTELASSSHGVERELCMVVDGQQLQARVELKVGPNQRLVGALWRDIDEPSGTDVVNALFGRVSAAQFREWPGRTQVLEELTFKAPRLVSVGGGTARILIDSDPYRVTARKFQLQVATPSERVASSKRKMTLDLRGGEVEASSTNVDLSEMMAHDRTPTNSDSRLQCRTPLQADTTRHVYLLHEESDASFTLARDRRVTFWSSDIAGDSVPVLDPFLWLGLGAVPYGLIAWYLSRNRLRRVEATNVALYLFWLLLAAGTLWTVRNIPWGSTARAMTERFSSWITGSSGSVSTPPVLVIDSLVLVGALAWPLLCWALYHPAPRPRVSSWRRHLGTAVPCLVVAAAAALAAVALMDWSPAPRAQAATIPAAAVLGAIIAGCIGLLMSASGAPALSMWGVTVLGVAAVGAAAISPFAFTTLERGWWFLARATYLFAVFCLTFGGAILLFSSLRVRFPKRRLMIGAALAGYFLIVGIFIVPRTIALVNLETFEAGPWSVLPFVDDLSALLFFVVLLSVIIALWRLGRRRADARATWLHRWLGVAFVLLNFYWYSDRWLYLPVTALLGWVLAIWWLLPHGQAHLVQQTRRMRAASGSTPAYEGKQLLELTLAEKRCRALVSTGAKSDLDSAREHYDRLRRNTADLTMPPLRRRWFGIPDGASPWELGVRGAVLGTGLGIPWMAIFLVILDREGFGYGIVEVERYPSLWMFAYVVGTLAQWPLYGFFLGYFFPYVRGSNAVGKALAMFVTTAVPPLVHGVLWWQLDWIEATLWWALQALVFAVSLGMLMDYLVARSAGVDRGTYIEIRGLTTLVGLSGAVVVATVAAVITLVQSTTALYVQNLLNISSGGTMGSGG